MKLVAIFLIVIVTMLMSCSKADNDIEPFCSSFVAGDLSVGIDNKINFQDAVSLINTNGVPIKEVFTIVYRSILPPDSIPYVIRQLNKKSYFASNGGFPDSQTVVSKNDSLTITLEFFDFDNNAQTDWFKTAATLNLVEQANLKSFLLTVPVGEEKDWARKFFAQPHVAYAQLNCHSMINPNYK